MNKNECKNQSCNYYKGHMDKIKGEGEGGGGRGVQLGWGGGMGRKGTQVQLNNNKKIKFKNRKKNQSCHFIQHPITEKVYLSFWGYLKLKVI